MVEVVIKEREGTIAPEVMRNYEDMILNDRYYSSFRDFELEARRRDDIATFYGNQATGRLLGAYNSQQQIVEQGFDRAYEGVEDGQDSKAWLIFIAFITERWGESARYRAGIRTLYESIYGASNAMYELMFSRYGGGGIPEEVLRSLAFNAVEKLETFFKYGVINSIDRVSKTAVRRGVRNVDDLKRLVIARYVTYRTVSPVVSRTAIGEIMGVVQMQSFANNRDIEYVRWVTRYDDRVRPAHRRNGSRNNGIIRVGGSWADGSTTCPKGYRCRCHAEGISGDDVRINRRGENEIRPNSGYIGSPYRRYPDGDQTGEVE